MDLDFTPTPLPRRTLTIRAHDHDPALVVAIGPTMGHLYYKVERANFDPAGYESVGAPSLTLTTEDLPLGYLYLHRGRFYYRDWTVTALGARVTPSRLTWAHHALERARQADDPAYRATRNSFLLVLAAQLASLTSPSVFELDSPGRSGLNFEARLVEVAWLLTGRVRYPVGDGTTRTVASSWVNWSH